MDDDALVEIYLAESSHQAHFLRNMLEDHGIDAKVLDEFSNLGVLPGDPEPPCLWVRRRDGLAARSILEEWDRAHAKSRP